MTTRSQQWAEEAFLRVDARSTQLQGQPRNEYASFAKSFPSLIHTCGLVQALAFAEAKKRRDYLKDLASVLATDPDRLLEQSRRLDLMGYVRLSRNAIEAAGWLKRYAEALMGDKS